MPKTARLDLTQAWLDFCKALPAVSVTSVELCLAKEYLLRHFTEMDEGRTNLPLALRYQHSRGSAVSVLDLACQHLMPIRAGALVCSKPGYTEGYLTFSREAVRTLLGDVAVASADALIDTQRKVLQDARRLAEHDQRSVAAGRETEVGRELVRRHQESAERLKGLTNGASLPSLNHTPKPDALAGTGA